MNPLLLLLLVVPALSTPDVTIPARTYTLYDTPVTASAAQAVCTKGKLAEFSSACSLNDFRAAIEGTSIDFAQTSTHEFWIFGSSGMNHHSLISESKLATESGDRCRILSNWVIPGGEKWNIYTKNCVGNRKVLCENN